ncbi:hypothetical protein [Streptomyces griseoviridis]
MRERSVDDTTGSGRDEEDAKGTEGARGTRIDLNVPQVAGGALAAVIAAKLASSFGVYGTILGAGVVSVVATCGGTLFQHFFRRTGEQLKVRRTAEEPRPAEVPAAAGPSLPGEFTEGTVYRARVRSWKRPVLAAALVFGVTMGGITAYELISGHNLSGGSSTTVSDAVSGHGGSSSDSGDDGSEDPGDDGTATPSTGPGRSADSGTGSGSTGTPSATPSGTAGSANGGASSGEGSARDDGTASDPTPTPSATGDGQGADGTATEDPGASATAPAPSASSRSGTGDQGQDGPAAP